MKLRNLLVCTALPALCLLPLASHAQQPTQLRLVVGYPAGGSSDAVARMLAEKLREDLGGTVLVENRPGAGGQIAADFVRQSPADGATILVANTHMMVMLPLTSKAVKYNPVTDFKPVGRITSFYNAIAVPAASSASTVKQWLDIVRSDPKQGNFGVPAAGSVAHFLGYRLGLDAKTGLTPVPYKGAAPLVQDLLGGQIAAGIVPVLDVAPHHAAGKLKVLAVNGSKRAQLLPTVPTLKELGVAGFDSLEWTALLAPAATPKPVLDRLNAALNKALADKDLQQRLLQLGMEAAPSSADELIQLISGDLSRWSPVIKASGFTTD